MTVESGFFMPCFNAVIIFFPFRNDERDLFTVRLQNGSSSQEEGLTVCFPRILLRSPANVCGTYTVNETEDSSNLQYLIDSAGRTSVRIKPQVFLVAMRGGEAVLFVCDGIYNSVADYNSTWRVLSVSEQTFCY